MTSICLAGRALVRHVGDRAGPERSQDQAAFSCIKRGSPCGRLITYYVRISLGSRSQRSGPESDLLALCTQASSAPYDH